MTCNEMAFFPSNFLLQTLQEHDSEAPPFLNHVLPSCSSQEFHGVASFLGKKSTSFSGIDVCPEEANNGEDEISDDGSQAGEKKRRLNMEQVKTLEKNFELGNKLDPERKMELAKALGLQPRQIAIWFQNRRARWKIKQLEKDYDMLKREFEGIRAENVALQAQNQKLHAEILALKSRDTTESINLNKETEGSCSYKRENNSETKLDISRTQAAIYNPISNPVTSIPLFPPSSYIRSPPIVAQVLFQQNPSFKPHDHFQYQNQMVKEESLSNMLCGIDDQSGFWPWLE